MTRVLIQAVALTLLMGGLGADAAEPDQVTVNGQVLDPSGKPFAGAKIYVSTYTPKSHTEPPVRATSGSDGRFTFPATRLEVSCNESVVAVGNDCGPDWVELSDLDAAGNLPSLRLVNDEPVTGTISDLEGRHGPAAWRTAYRLLGNRADADECLQETFLTALDVSGRQSVANWDALLVRLAASRAIDRLRSRDRRRRREQTAASRSTPRPPAPPYRDLAQQELADNLRVALAELPRKRAEVFYLHCLDEWSYQQIAEQLAISVNAVGVLLHRARARLRTLLAAFAPDPGLTGQQTDGMPVGSASRKDNQ